MAYSFKLINELVNNQKSLEPIDNPYQVFINALLNKESCDSFLGMKNTNGKVYFSRYSIYEFCYDLLEHIIPIENQLIAKGLLQPEHYFYQQVKEKFKDSAQLNDFYIFTTLISLQTKGCSHWNHSKLLSQEDIESIVIKECSYGGMKNFKLLSKIFSLDDFKNTHITYNNDPNLKLNLREYTVCNLLNCNNPAKQNSFLNLVEFLECCEIPIDYKKVRSIVRTENVNYFSLKLLDNNELNNSIVYTSINKKDYTFRFLDYVKNVHILKGLEKITEGKSFKNINDKIYDSFTAFKEYVISSDIKETLPLFIEDKISSFKDKNKKIQWQHIKMDLIVPEVIKAKNKNKI